LPKSLVSKINASNIRVYISGRNLWTYSKIEDYDPERGGNFTNPMTKVFVGGVNVDF
jgi:hypothetical protein